MAFTLTSPAFADGEAIPVRFTCQGEDISPLLMWHDIPAGTRSFALIVHDPDAPRGDVTHWVLCDIPADVHELPEGLTKDTPRELGVFGTNSMDKEAYSGPCPPPGDPAHRYRFEVYALDVERLGQGQPGPGRAQVEAAMAYHVLAQATLTGLYQRQ